MKMTRTPEHILKHIWDQMPDDAQGWGYQFYPVRDTWAGPAELYFTDSDGVCWQITAKEHPHDG